MHDSSKVLIVDDDSPARETMEALLEGQGYELVLAQNGQEALSLASQHRPDLVLLDVMMPDIDGFEVCRRLRMDPRLSEVPILLITSLDDRESRLRGMSAGADDFITKPFDRTELRARVRTITRLNRYRSLIEEREKFERSVIELSHDGVMIVSESEAIVLANPLMIHMLGGEDGDKDDIIGKSVLAFVARGYVASFGAWIHRLIQDEQGTTQIEQELIDLDGREFPALITGGRIIWDSMPAAQVTVRDMSERHRTAELVERATTDLSLDFDATLGNLVRALDARNKEIEGHTYRVTEMTVRLARAFGIFGKELEHIRRGALLHDIGKLAVPDSILFKPGPLTDEEWVIMHKHPVYAYEWFSPIKYLRHSLDIPYSHHEKWDGTGYPRGLKEEEIPLAARMFAVVDVWDALRSERVYRAAWTEGQVRSHIWSLAGTHFDPKVVEEFLGLYCPFI